MLLDAIFAALLVSLVSLVGIALFNVGQRTLLFLVSFAAGIFLGAFFLHVLPRVAALGDTAYIIILLSFVGFVLLEKFLHFHEHFQKRSIGWINLLGDFFHNFLDGLGIAGAFKINPTFGWLFTFIVLAHEIPQELGDYAILVYSGFKRKKALLLNFLTALTAIFGVIAGWFLQADPRILVAIVGGSFLYIGASDLIPLLREEIRERREFVISFVLFLLGIGVMLLVRSLKV